MKLELKHLAPYLPYGLNAQIVDFKSDYVGKEFDTVIGLHQWDSAGLFWSVLTKGGAKPSIDKVKPILRPLSDLTEKELRGQGFWHHIDALLYHKVDATHIPYNMVVYLLSNHFDVFGLIPEGLAIDINTVKL